MLVANTLCLTPREIASISRKRTTGYPDAKCPRTELALAISLRNMHNQSTIK